MDVITTLLIIGAWFCIGWNFKGLYDLRRKRRG